MVILGIILALIGWVIGSPLLVWIGIILLLVGLVLNFAGPVGPTGTRRRWY